MHATTEPLRSSAPRGRGLDRAKRGALAALLRGELATSFGVRLARGVSAAIVLGYAGLSIVLVTRDGTDSTLPGLVATGAAWLAWVPGGLAALSLARAPRSAGDSAAVLALATLRGIPAEAAEIATMRSVVRLLAEIVTVPAALLAAVGVAIAPGHAPRTMLSLAGTAVFGLFAAIAIGTLAAACRRFGGERGRSWLVGIVVVPWMIADSLFVARGELLSLPGLLSFLWHQLSGMAA